MPPARPAVRAVTVAWPWLLAVAVTLPLLAPGFVLSYDMVFVPKQSLVPEALGLGGPLPRAVPVDAVLALVTQAVPGDWVQKLVLVGLLGFAGWGAAALVPSRSVVARLAAATWYVWNPFVAERLVIGHWTLLVGYAALPWLVRAALDLRRGVPGAQLRVLALLVPAALAAGPAAVALLTVVPVLAYRADRRQLTRLAVTVVGWAVLNAPWWLPGLLHPTRGRSAEVGVAVFAARAEGPLGALGALLGLGGVWNADVVPDSRALVTGSVWLVVLLTVCAVGVRPLVQRLGPGGAGLLVAAGLGLGLAALASVPPLTDTVGWMVRTLPGAGLIRDGQKFVAPLALAESAAFGLGCAVVARRLAGGAGRALAVALVVSPLVVLPDLAWGVAGRLQPVAYPSDWAAVRAVLLEEPDTGDVVSLPWQPFRRFAWNDERVMLDPAPRWLPTSVVVDDSLTVAGRTVSGEDPRAAEVATVLRSGRPLAEALPVLGVGWALIEQGTPGSVDERGLVGATTVFSGEELVLLRLGDSRSPDPPPWAMAVIVADGLAVVTAAGAVVAAGWVSLPGRPRRARRRW